MGKRDSVHRMRHLYYGETGVQWGNEAVVYIPLVPKYTCLSNSPLRSRATSKGRDRGKYDTQLFVEKENPHSAPSLHPLSGGR